MSVAKHPIRLPLLPASLAAFLLLLGTGLLFFSLFKESHSANTRQSTAELASTVDQLARVVNVDSTQWVHSDQLAQLVASADTQINRLDHLNDSFFAWSWSGNKVASVRNVGADWKLLREGLLSFNKANIDQAILNQANLNQTSTEQINPNQPENPAPAASPSPAIDAGAGLVESVQIIIPSDFAKQSIALAKNFEVIRESVKDSTRRQALIDLVEVTSATWTQINSSNAEALVGLLELQQEYADELLQLSGAGTQQSLFGYYNSNQIVDYVQGVKSIPPLKQVVSVVSTPAEVPAGEASAVTATEMAPEEIKPEPMQPEPMQSAQINGSTPLSSAFVTQALTPLQESVAGLGNIIASETDRGNLIKWFGLAGLTASLLLLLSAISRMTHAADILKMRPERLPTPVPTGSRGAMSLREADTLIEDINSVVDGDLRQAVPLQANSHARAIAKSANRSSVIISDLVGMTRGVAAQLNGLVERQDQHGRLLADLDIRRQTETAELSDGIGVRSIYLDKQRVLLTSSVEVLNDLTNRSESAVNGVNQVSSSLAAVSAQVDVGVERMQRLMKTAGSVTEATARLNQLTEQTRLQALNVSLKMPQVTQAKNPTESRAAASVNDEYNSYEEFSTPGIVSRDTVDYDLTQSHDTSEELTSMFDDIHQLTGKLVQVSNDANVLIGALQKDIEDTATALRQSGEHMNVSAHHIHSTSLLGKELTGYSDQLRNNIEEALQKLQSQQDDLSQTAEQIVRLDKTGNDTSELTLALVQDLAGLQQMSSKLEESVSDFKISGDNPLE